MTRYHVLLGCLSAAICLYLLFSLIPAGSTKGTSPAREGTALGRIVSFVLNFGVAAAFAWVAWRCLHGGFR